MMHNTIYTTNAMQLSRGRVALPMAFSQKTATSLPPVFSPRHNSATTRRSSHPTVHCSSEPLHRQSRGKYADLLTGSPEAQSAMRWSTATVVENRSASADGTARTLVLSVDDAVIYSDGRRLRHVQENVRWLDTYSAPGQLVAVRYRKDGGSLEDPTDAAIAPRLLALTSSPYEARSTSATLDAAIVEILVRRNATSDGENNTSNSSNDGDDDDQEVLAALGPGSLIQVSEVLGNGFSSLFNSVVNLQSCLEEGRPILIIADGCRGIAPARAALDWAPLSAHAGVQPVVLVYLADSPASAAYLVEFDGWRDAGVDVRPLYIGAPASTPAGFTVSDNAGNSLNNLQLMLLLEKELFGGAQGLRSALNDGRPEEAAVVLSGLPGEVAAALTRKLTHEGVSSERLLVCEYGLI